MGMEPWNLAVWATTSLGMGSCTCTPWHQQSFRYSYTVWAPTLQ